MTIQRLLNAKSLREAQPLIATAAGALIGRALWELSLNTDMVADQHIADLCARRIRLQLENIAPNEEPILIGFCYIVEKYHVVTEISLTTGTVVRRPLEGFEPQEARRWESVIRTCVVSGLLLASMLMPDKSFVFEMKPHHFTTNNGEMRYLKTS